MFPSKISPRVHNLLPVIFLLLVGVLGFFSIAGHVSPWIAIPLAIAAVLYAAVHTPRSIDDVDRTKRNIVDRLLDRFFPEEDESDRRCERCGSKECAGKYE